MKIVELINKNVFAYVWRLIYIFAYQLTSSAIWIFFVLSIVASQAGNIST